MKKDNYHVLDSTFAQSLTNIIAAELNQNIIICDHHGVIIAAFDRKRISQVHEGAANMLSSGNIREFSISSADEKLLKNVRRGYDVPIVVEGRCIGVIGVTGEPEKVALYARLAARFVQATLESNSRQQKLVQALKEKEELQSILLYKIIDVQEEERKKISRELHDEISQSLTSVIVGLRVLSEQVCGDKEQKFVLEMRDVVSKTLDNAHRLALELRPALLDDLGLVAAAQRYIENYSRQYGITADINFSGLSRERFRPEIEITLYRILQETLTNIAKHAQASNVKVSLKKTRREIHFSITDDGIGFTPKSLRTACENSSLGIYGMRERVALLAGKFTIQSSEGAGTTVTVVIPLKDTRDNTISINS
ncbi:hypothetical protein SPSIL_017990 [Sporomusa silvacetica DSM 10669]|uniref:Oxygen sensor histidine kinase NreB n=1 Tax=Sporomusa silvacetica DSM 10669 TaxID=1123289 RepID=A0ABZ3IJ12_9FIRM|nr:sugar diacid recognition domain-containing protein [Sporomusa silvacetica]OZC18452.1 oxygen sensor histidine kinase NreB [Sporomusa silvacetica DSM 10669]